MALLLSSLALLRALSSGLLGCLVMIATTSFVLQTTWQYADIPAGFYYLATLVLVFLSGMERGREPAVLLAMAGAYGSFAALTKNEGIPFLLSILACYFVIAWWMQGMKPSLAKGRYWLAGALPGILLLGCFKLLLAPPATPLRGQTATQVMEKLGDPGRYTTVIGALFSEAGALGQGFSHPLLLLVVLAIVLRFNIDRQHRLALAVGALTLALLLVTYIGVYLVTRDDLTWRLDTSLIRLYAQIWPSALFLVFMVLNSVQDLPAAASATRKASPGKRKARRRKRGH